VTEVSLRELICEIRLMEELVKKLRIFDEQEGKFRTSIEISMGEARLAQRCIQSYMDILLDQKVKAGEY